MQRLKSTQVKQQRIDMLVAQAGRCALCGETIEDGETAVLDHDHKTGHVRAVLHRGCNAMLGHIENNRARNHLQGGRLGRMLRAVFDYIHRDYSANPLYPTHRTDDEKRERRNAKARAARAAKRAD